MAFKEIYIDPAINANSGTGTIGDPFGDLLYAIKQSTQGTAGTRLNIKRSTDEVCLGDLGANGFADTSVTPAWAYNVNNPIIFQGYDTAAGDLAGTGNRAGISGNNANIILNGASAVGVAFIDLHLHSGGSQASGMVRTAGNSALIRCEIDNVTGRGFLLGTGALVVGCYVHDVTTNAIDITSGMAYGNIVTNTGAKEMAKAIALGATAVAQNNIISIDGASDGIYCIDRNNTLINNSIYSAGGTGTGLFLTDVDGYVGMVANNLIEGFSGSGGAGIEFAGTNPHLVLGARNLIYNCATAVIIPGDYIGTEDTWGLAAIHEVLSASPFTNAAGFDFRPVDTGNVKEGSCPPGFMTI